MWSVASLYFVIWELNVTRQISTSYSRFSGHSDKDLADLVIDPESAIRDVERMCRWATEFIGLGTKVYCYNKGCDRATASTIVSYRT